MRAKFFTSARAAGSYYGPSLATAVFSVLTARHLVHLSKRRESARLLRRTVAVNREVISLRRAVVCVVARTNRDGRYPR